MAATSRNLQKKNLTFRKPAKKWNTYLSQKPPFRRGSYITRNRKSQHVAHQTKKYLLPTLLRGTLNYTPVWQGGGTEERGQKSCIRQGRTQKKINHRCLPGGPRATYLPASRGEDAEPSSLSARRGIPPTCNPAGWHALTGV